MKKLFLLIILPLLFGQTAYSQNIVELNYGVQADVSSIYFVNTLSGAFDMDIFKLSKDSYAGIRLGVETYDHLSPGGKVGGSPYTDIDFLTRLNVFGEVVEVNLCPGITYHKTTDLKNENGLYIKAAGDIKFKIYKNYFGVIVKFAISKQGYGGLGIFLGYNSKDNK